MLPVDFAVEYEGMLMLVETKASLRPLASGVVFSAFGALSLAQRAISNRVSMVLVSMTGFSDRVEAAFAGIEEFSLISWQVHEGPEPLRVAFRGHLSKVLR